jgi:H+/Cl- antiporter ClcA
MLSEKHSDKPLPFRWDVREHLAIFAFLLKWLLITVPLGAAVGSAVALFLWSLDRATDLRWQYPWLLYLLPLAGVAIAWMYQSFGKSVEAGNNLIMDQIHEPGGGVPLRMAPLVLLGTVITHLFGGSAGREGTAVQMGGGIAGSFCKALRLSHHDTRILIMAGVAAGFGAVFGTPLTGAIFALEVLAIGRMSYEALIPCLAASIIGDAVTQAWGVGHSHYFIAPFTDLNIVEHVPNLSWSLVGKVALAAIAFGLASVLFSEMAHGLHHLFRQYVRRAMLRPVIGGLLVIGLVMLLGTRDYLGLGVVGPPDDPDAVSITSCFRADGANWFSWWWKILFTTITLSSGFKGGEVTPLFFIGAALGNVMARLLGAPVDLFAGLGFVAVFAGATNTPLACTIMGLELFAVWNGDLLGSGLVVYLAIACFLSYAVSGHSGIYLSQRIGTPKSLGFALPPGLSLRSLRKSPSSVVPTQISSIPEPPAGGQADSLTGVEPPDEREKTGRVEVSRPADRSNSDRELGWLRIYISTTARTRTDSKGPLGGWWSKPLYQQILERASHSGELRATAHLAYGNAPPSGRSTADAETRPDGETESLIADDTRAVAPAPAAGQGGEPVELPPQVQVCVEISGEKGALRRFRDEHRELLDGLPILYRHAEQW